MQTRLLLVAGSGILIASRAIAQTPAMLYTWPSTTSDWFRNFGAAGTGATLSNSGGALRITEIGGPAGASQAFTDGFFTDRESHGFGTIGGADLTGLSFLQFDMGHNGSAPVNVQFFTQATPGSTFLSLGPDISIAPGMATYMVPLAGLSPAQITYLRTIGFNTRDHAAQGNLTWTINEVRSAGTPQTTRIIADHDGGATDFDGLICNFDNQGIQGNNGGQNNSGISIVNGSSQWTDLGGGPGGAVTWGNGTQEPGGSFNARPVDLTNYDTVTIRMSATGLDASVGVQFYMQTEGAFFYQSLNDTLIVDGQFHDLVFPLAGITHRDFVNTNGINLFAHANDLVIRVDSVIYHQVPGPSGAALLALAGARATRRKAIRRSWS